VFDQISVDGFFTDANNDMSWAHATKDDPEWGDFVGGNAQSGGTLVFGRITYQMMASFWPTPQGRERDPIVAEGMTNAQKIVFSRTLEDAGWRNTKLIKGDPASEMRKLKQEPGSDMTILGSGKIVAQLTQERLIDEYTIVVHPIVLGSGRTLFEGVRDKRQLKLTKSRSFRNGVVVLWYQPAA
jgi:dihydrofolate reductase